jgi:hypothetical protein
MFTLLAIIFLKRNKNKNNVEFRALLYGSAHSLGS